MKRSFKLLECQDVLTEVGFLQAHGITCGNSIKEDTVVAGYVFDLMRNVSVNEMLAASFFRDRPPFGFHGLR